MEQVISEKWNDNKKVDASKKAISLIIVYIVYDFKSNFCNFADMFGPGLNKNPLDMIHTIVTIIFIQSLSQLNVNLDPIILLGQLWLKIFHVISHVLYIVAPRITKTGFSVRTWFLWKWMVALFYFPTLTKC